MTNELTQSTDTPEFKTGLAIFDSGQFEKLYRIAEVLGKSSLIPTALQGKTDEETTANCLLVVEQSHRWKLSPFAVAQCASVVHGRLMWEGKLVHAVIQSLTGINLTYDISGEGDGMQVIVSGTLHGESEPRTVKGTAKQWKTTHNGSPWSNPLDYPRQLRYRGAREWSRAHNPAVMLGILAEDEARDISEPRNITPTQSRLRDTPIEPFSTPDDLKAIPEPPAEPEIPANPATLEPEGRQKKERIQRDGKFWNIKPLTSDQGKAFWKVTIRISGKDVEFVTFSETLASRLEALDFKAPIRITVVETAQKGTFQLETFEELTEEGVE